MSKLSAEYIADHASSVHTYDSFGRLIVSSILDQAQQTVGKGEADEMKVQLEFRVTPTSIGCLLVWNGQYNVHVMRRPTLE
jgi:hypothetical protein